MRIKQFGRTLNVNTMMYEFSDGSGVPLPYEKVEEIRYWMELGEPGSFLIGLAIKEDYEKRHRTKTDRQEASTTSN